MKPSALALAALLPLSASAWTINDNHYPSVETNVLSYTKSDNKIAKTGISFHILVDPRDNEKIVSFVMPNTIDHHCGFKPKQAFSDDSYREFKAGTIKVQGQYIRALGICNYNWQLDYENKNADGSRKWKGKWMVEFQPETDAGKDYLLNALSRNASQGKETIVEMNYYRSSDGETYFIPIKGIKGALNFIESKINAI